MQYSLKALAVRRQRRVNYNCRTYDSKEHKLPVRKRQAFKPTKVWRLMLASDLSLFYCNCIAYLQK